MDGNDNKEEKTREVANNRMYHFGCNKDVIYCEKEEKDASKEE